MSVSFQVISFNKSERAIPIQTPIFVEYKNPEIYDCYIVNIVFSDDSAGFVEELCRDVVIYVDKNIDPLEGIKKETRKWLAKVLGKR